MADRLWSAWYDAVVPLVPGCPLAAADYAIKRSAIDFCERSRAWRRALPAIDSQNGIAEYPLPDVATGVQVAQVLEARWLGKELTKARPDELKDAYVPLDWRSLTAGTPQFFTEETARVLRLVPAPNVTTVAAINGLWVAARPKDDATGIDDAFASDNHEAIARGALEKLFRSPHKPYSNPPQADYYAALFVSDIGSAAFRAFKANGVKARTKTYFS